MFYVHFYIKIYVKYNIKSTNCQNHVNARMHHLFRKQTSGRGNLTKMLNRRRTWTDRSYSPSCASMHPFGPTQVYIGLPNGIRFSRFAQIAVVSLHFTIAPSRGRIWTPSNTLFLLFVVGFHCVRFCFFRTTTRDWLGTGR